MSVYNDYKAPEGEGGIYLKFKDGESVKLRLVSEPYIYYAQFNQDSPIQTRYAWAVYNHSEDKGQILQLPVTAFRKIQDLAVDDEWGDPSAYDIKITRTGTKLDTTYSVVGSPTKVPLTPEQLAKAQLSVVEKVGGAIPLARVIEGDTPSAPKVSDNASSPVEDVVIENLGNEPVNLDDIPF